MSGRSLSELAAALQCKVRGDDRIEITGIASLAEAGPGQLAFLFSPAYAHHLESTRAAAVVVRADHIPECDVPLLICEQPRLAWATVAALYDPAPTLPMGVHPSAIIAESARLGQRVAIGPKVVIGENCALADDVAVEAGCVIGAGTQLGAATRLHPNVTLYHGVRLGAGCIVHSGAIIGADGFGFEFDPQSASLAKIPQIYSVQIGDNVEIGANTTIDRGALNDTVIGQGVKLDNQVQIGHGTRIGPHTAISGRAAVAGSTRIGAYCLIGGAVGIIDNIEIADRVEITAMTLVSQSIDTPGRYSSGTGLMPGQQWKRSVVGFRRLDEILKRLRRLESR